MYFQIWNVPFRMLIIFNVLYLKEVRTQILKRKKSRKLDRFKNFIFEALHFCKYYICLIFYYFRVELGKLKTTVSLTFFAFYFFFFCSDPTRCSFVRAYMGAIEDCGNQKIRFRKVPFRERSGHVSSSNVEHVVDVDRAGTNGSLQRRHSVPNPSTFTVSHKRRRTFFEKAFASIKRDLSLPLFNSSLFGIKIL